MRALVHTVLALALTLAALAVAPARAWAAPGAVPCMTGHASFLIGSPAAGQRRVLRARITQVSDTDDWTGHMTVDLAVAAVYGDFRYTYYRLGGTGEMAYSDRTTCAGAGCSLLQGFSRFARDVFSVQPLLVRDEFGGFYLSLRLANTTWGGLVTSAGDGRCVNAGTVLFAVPGVATFFVTFTDVELPL